LQMHQRGQTRLIDHTGCYTLLLSSPAPKGFHCTSTSLYLARSAATCDRANQSSLTPLNLKHR
jgi:hypothetical protein